MWGAIEYTWRPIEHLKIQKTGILKFSSVFKFQIFGSIWGENDIVS